MVVVAEGLLMYLDTTAQRGLFARTGTLLRGAGGQFIFDLVPPAEAPVAAELALPYPSTWTRQVVFRATRAPSPEEAGS